MNEFVVELVISESGMVVHRSHLRADGPIIGVNAMTVHGGDPNRAMHTMQLMPWQDVEEIAAYVRGNGKDAQRHALADGILRGFQKPTEMLIYDTSRKIE